MLRMILLVSLALCAAAASSSTTAFSPVPGVLQFTKNCDNVALRVTSRPVQRDGSRTNLLQEIVAEEKHTDVKPV